VLTASVITAARRGSWSHQPAQAPALPPFETLPAFEPRLALVGGAVRISLRRGRAGAERAAARATAQRPLAAWLRDDTPRPLDFISLLAAMSDASSAASSR
jgi:hypothetical protein